jgi:hypothetical protein
MLWFRRRTQVEELEQSMNIFAISGYKRSGKDTVSYLIRQNCSEKIDHYAFADPLREVAMSFFGWSPHMFNDEMKEKIDPLWGISPRQALQFIGTEVGRIALPETFENFRNIVGDTIWIKRFHMYIDEINRNTDIKGFTISDMRFMNELESVESLSDEHNVITIAVERDDLEIDNHASEKGIGEVMKRCKYTINNNGSLKKLENSIQNILFEHNLLQLR